MSVRNPIYLLADSQLLFWKMGSNRFLESIVLRCRSSPIAAYLGASNRDDPQYYRIFQEAMGSLNVRDCRMIKAVFSKEDRAFLERANIFLLAGGDIELGWKAFQSMSLEKSLPFKYEAGAILLGLSAGAVQLGQKGWRDSPPAGEQEEFETFQLAPFIVGAHEETSGWSTLRRILSLQSGCAKAIGIRTGGGLIYHPHGSIEAVRRPLDEFIKTDLQLSHRVLLPGVWRVEEEAIGRTL